MAFARGRRRERGIDYWPGFVDALSTLLLSIIFMLSIFMLAQFFLSQEVTGKDEALDRLNAQVAELSQLLALEKASGASLADQLSALTDGLETATAETAKLTTLVDAARGDAAAAMASGGQVGVLTAQLEGERKISAQALAQVELLNQQIAALRRQIAALEEALDASEARDLADQVRQRLMNKALVDSYGCAIDHLHDELFRDGSDTVWGLVRTEIDSDSRVEVRQHKWGNVPKQTWVWTGPVMEDDEDY